MQGNTPIPACCVTPDPRILHSSTPGPCPGLGMAQDVFNCPTHSRSRHVEQEQHCFSWPRAALLLLLLRLPVLALPSPHTPAASCCHSTCTCVCCLQPCVPASPAPALPAASASCCACLQTAPATAAGLSNTPDEVSTSYRQDKYSGQCRPLLQGALQKQASCTPAAAQPLPLPHPKAAHLVQTMWVHGLG